MTSAALWRRSSRIQTMKKERHCLRSEHCITCVVRVVTRACTCSHMHWWPKTSICLTFVLRCATSSCAQALRRSVRAGCIQCSCCWLSPRWTFFTAAEFEIYPMCAAKPKSAWLARRGAQFVSPPCILTAHVPEACPDPASVLMTASASTVQPCDRGGCAGDSSGAAGVTQRIGGADSHHGAVLRSCVSLPPLLTRGARRSFGHSGRSHSLRACANARYCHASSSRRSRIL